MTAKLRDRCVKICHKMQQDGVLRQWSPVDTLYEFVLSELGRGAEKQLEDSAPLVLYFADKKDRNGFVDMVRGMKPGMVMKEMP